MNKRVDQFKYTLTHPNNGNREMHSVRTHTLKQLVRVPNRKRMISNDHCSAFHVAISLWALNIKDDYERAHMFLCVHVWVSTRVLASVCAAYTQFIFGCSLALSLLYSVPATISQPDSNVKMLHICSMQTLHCECLIFGCHAWICAHFFPGWIFFSLLSYTDRFNMTSCHYEEALHISKQNTERKRKKKIFHFLREILWEGWELEVFCSFVRHIHRCDDMGCIQIATRQHEHNFKM